MEKELIGSRDDSGIVVVVVDDERLYFHEFHSD